MNKLSGPVADYLPYSEGFLPLAVLLVLLPSLVEESTANNGQTGVTAITNAASCYNTDAYVRRLYAGHLSRPTTGVSKTTTKTTEVVESASPIADRRPSHTALASAGADDSPVTPLGARIFGAWNIAVGIVRLYASYHIHEASWYQMQMLACMIGLFHFGTEAFVYKTARPSGPWLAPVLTASLCLVWSIAQYRFYVR